MHGTPPPLWPSVELASSLLQQQYVPEGGTTEPACPACGHRFAAMPQRKRACPTCGAFMYSRTCPARGKSLWLEHELPILERAWGLHAVGAELCRSAAFDDLERWIAARFFEMAKSEAEERWGDERFSWVHIAGACASKMLFGLGAHALGGAIVLDLSGACASPPFGAVRDERFTRRLMSELEGTPAPPLPCDPADFVRDAATPSLWWPRRAIRDHAVGTVDSRLLAALETFCGVAKRDMAFVRQSLELHSAALMARCPLVVPVDVVWERFVVLAQRAR